MTRNEYRYGIGGMRFALTMPPFDEGANLPRFAVPNGEPDVRVDLKLADELPFPDGEVLRVHGTRTDVRTPAGTVRVTAEEYDGSVLMTDLMTGYSHDVRFCAAHADYVSANLVLRILDLPHFFLSHGGIFLHASFIEVGGQAILFTAPKQTGKSTQAELWRALRGARVINGDRALLRQMDGVWYAWGSPYCGTSGICQNAALPIRAVVVLSQAPQSTASRADVRRSLAALLDGCTFDTDDRAQVESALAIASQIVTSVPFYTLACLPDESAVTALESVL